MKNLITLRKKHSPLGEGVSRPGGNIRGRRGFSGVIFLGSFALLLIVSGCCNRRPAQSSIITVTDTAWVDKTVIIRDTVLMATADSTEFSFDCDSLLKAFERGSKPIRKLGNKQSSLTIRGDPDGRIHVSANCDSVAIAAQIRDRLIKEYSKKTTKEVVVVPEPYTPQHIKYLASFGAIALVFLAIAIIWKLK